jgi:hypothetical protein
MHPITIEFLANDHLAELRREANHPHVPESPPAIGDRSRARAGLVIVVAAIARRILRHAVVPVR